LYMYMYRLVRYMYISFDVYDCGKWTNTAALEKSGLLKNLGVHLCTKPRF